MKTSSFILHKTTILIIIGFSIFCSSCNHYYYAPNDAYLMSLSEKGDVKTSVSFGGVNSALNNSKRNAYNIQAGFSPIQHLGIQGSYFKLIEKETTDNDTGQSGKGQIGEFAIGGYYSTKNSTTFDKKVFLVYDFYAGMGWGEVSNNYRTSTSSFLTFKKHFIQAGIHLHVQKNFTASFGLMFGSLNYRKATIFGVIPSYEDNVIATIDAQEPFFMWSPSLRMQFGMDQAKLFLSVKSVNIPKDQSFEYLPSFIQFGILLEPDEFFRIEKMN